jgi:integrase/recombinase XerD
MKTQLAHTNALIREGSMSKQAKTLTAAELRRVLDYVATRNRCVLLLTHYAGLRVGEAACLRLSDVVDAGGTIKTEIQLTAQQTKGGYARTVYINLKNAVGIIVKNSCNPILACVCDK